MNTIHYCVFNPCEQSCFRTTLLGVNKKKCLYNLLIVSKMASFDCDVCGKTFGQANNRNRHRRGHDLEFKCGKCDKTLKGLKLLQDHEKSAHKVTSFDCDICGKTFDQVYNRNRHRKTHDLEVKCGKCDKTLKGLKLLRDHVKAAHKVDESKKVLVIRPDKPKPKGDTTGDVIHENDDMLIVCWANAFTGYFQSYHIIPKKQYGDMLLFLKDANIMIRKLVEDRVGVKLWICVKAQLVKLDGEEMDVHLSTRQMVVLTGADVDEVVDEALADVGKKFMEKQHTGSGWILKSILLADIHLSRYMPLRRKNV